MPKRRLLLADDSVTIQKVVNLTFADEGIEVVIAGDGDTAMKKFVEATPDLVMADVNMPGLDGYRICEMIKQDDETKQIPVILLVGSFEPFDEEEARRVGADDYLIKPFQSIRQLVHKVSVLLNLDIGGETASETSAFTSAIEGVETKNEALELNSTDSVGKPLGDAGMDDEMIQTNQIGSLPADEAQKFSSDSAAESATEDFRQPSETGFRNLAGYETPEETSAKTQPLSIAELDKLNFDSSVTNSAASDEKVYELADGQNFADKEAADRIKAAQPDAEDNPPVSEQIITDETKDEQSFSTQTSGGESDYATLEKNSETFPPPETVAPLYSDDLNRLDQPKPETEENFQKTDNQTQPNDFSPELIEAIANKVAENITDKVVREIARELAPQIASLLVRQMNQEQMKE
ncbi:MAG: response regulator [Acidobacteria bacterium]|nr:response regulator [Acidobacteriota bacterium]